MGKPIRLTAHFIQRLGERLPGVCPEHFSASLRWALDNNRNDLVQYAGRQTDRDQDVRRQFRFKACGVSFIAIMIEGTTADRLVTVIRENEEGT